MTASLEKARLKDVHSAQPTPLTSSPSVVPPVVDSGTAAPCPSAVPTAPQDYDYGDRYGGYQPTRFNSSAVDDQELDARNEWNYHQGYYPHRSASSAQGYPTRYSAPFYQADAYGQGHFASTANTRENSSSALDRMERLMEGMSRSAAASAQAIQSFVGQGEFIVFLEFISLFYSSSMGPVGRPPYVRLSLEEGWVKAAGFLRASPICATGLRPWQVIGALGDSNTLFGLIFFLALVPSPTGSLVTCGRTDLFFGWLGFSLKIVSGSPLGSVERLHVHTRLYPI
jgi:hypothetical protein